MLLVIFFFIHCQAVVPGSAGSILLDVADSAGSLLSPIDQLKNAQLLLSVARQDPKAFTEMFNKADPVKIQKVIELLEALITTANSEKVTLAHAVYVAHEALDRAIAALEQKLGQCAAVGRELDSAKIKVADATGVVDEATGLLTEAEPGLKDEIATLNGVIETLQNMKDVQGFVEDHANARKLLSAIQDAKAFLATFANADPEALREVIELLRGLVSEADAQLGSLQGDVDVAVANFNAAEAEVDKAEGHLIHCNNGRDVLIAKKSKAEGIFRSVKADYDARESVLRNEMDTLQHVIDILLSLMS